MRIYLAHAKMGIKQQFAYKSDLWMNVFGMIIAFALWIFFWIGLYGGRETIDGVSLKQVLAYMAISYALLIPQIHSMRARYPFHEKMVKGTIIFDILRPGYFVWKFLAERIATSFFFFFVIVLPIYGGITLFLIGYQPDTLQLLYFLLAAVGSVSIGFLINLNLCLLMVRYVEMSGAWLVFNSIAFFFGGMPIPVWVYPEWVQTIIGALPYQYLYFIPTGILTGMVPSELIVSKLLGAAGWIVVLLLLSVILWQRMLRDLVIQGG